MLDCRKCGHTVHNSVNEVSGSEKMKSSSDRSGGRRGCAERNLQVQIVRRETEVKAGCEEVGVN